MCKKPLFYFRDENSLKLYIGIFLSALSQFTFSVTKPDQYALHKYW
jgi:hypothetical protein